MQSSIIHTSQKTSEINDHRNLKQPSLDTMWDQLTFAQQFSISSLGQFGYTLSSTRIVYSSVLAVLHLNDKTATITQDGTIDITSGIDVRH